MTWDFKGFTMFKQTHTVSHIVQFITSYHIKQNPSHIITYNCCSYPNNTPISWLDLIGPKWDHHVFFKTKGLCDFPPTTGSRSRRGTSPPQGHELQEHQAIQTRMLQHLVLLRGTSANFARQTARGLVGWFLCVAGCKNSFFYPLVI